MFGDLASVRTRYRERPPMNPEEIRAFYDDLWALDRLAAEIHAGDAKVARGPRHGIPRGVYDPYIRSLGLVSIMPANQRLQISSR